MAISHTDLQQLEQENGHQLTLDQLNSYDKILVQLSGGKDSVYCFLYLLDLGVDLHRIELWHQEIDGREGSSLMDWAVTSDYCRKFANHFGVPILYQWKKGGMERELIREDELTQPTMFELLDGTVIQKGGTRGKKSTRRKFPQQSGSLSTRWCSSYLKIDVHSLAINNDPRFKGRREDGTIPRTLVVTGERAEEARSLDKGRATYSQFEPHRIDKRDHHLDKVVKLVDHYRPALYKSETQVWDLIRKFRVKTHPVYDLGISRVSCATCIFSSANQWATLALINPSQVDQVINYEQDFGVTINRRNTIKEMIQKGVPHTASPEVIEACLAEDYDGPIQVSAEDWKLPSGAFGESCGPI